MSNEIYLNEIDRIRIQTLTELLEELNQSINTLTETFKKKEKIVPSDTDEEIL